jgi:cytochrome c-type biogenesis protein CcmH/NrfF
MDGITALLWVFAVFAVLIPIAAVFVAVKSRKRGKVERHAD